MEEQEETILADASMEEIIQQFRELKDEKDRLNKIVKDLNPQIEYLQGLIITVPKRRSFRAHPRPPRLG